MPGVNYPELHKARVDDPRTIKVVSRRQQLPDQALFQYESGTGVPHSISYTDVNEYPREGHRRRIHREGLPQVGTRCRGGVSAR